MASGSLTAVELLGRCREQIAAHDRRGAALAAIICQNDAAENDARASDERRRCSAANRGALDGMPVVLKDNIDMRGLPTTSGCRALSQAIARNDAEATRQLRQAGAIIVAKTNMSEFSFEIRSRSSLAGDVRNPFDPAVTAGGSSGGTAVAVAAGFAVAGLGTDTGGSIRVPAAFNGLVGLRPTHGLIGLQGVAPLAPSTDTIGPIARCVRDLAAVLGAMTGTPDTTWLPHSTQARQRLSGARIGVLRQAFGSDPHIDAAMAAALTTMADAGAVLVDPLEVPADVLPVGWPPLVDWEFRASFDAYLRDNFAPGSAPASLAQVFAGGDFLPEYRESLRRRLEVTDVDCEPYREVRAHHERLRRTLAAQMDRYRLVSIVYPTSMVLPSSLENPAAGWATELAACCGWPALTVPAGRSPGGLPIGLEFLGRPRAETELLCLAHDFEQRGPGRYIPVL